MARPEPKPKVYDERKLKAPYLGTTIMRAAFEATKVPAGGSRLVGSILAALRSKVGTFTAPGWGVIRK